MTGTEPGEAGMAETGFPRDPTKRSKDYADTKADKSRADGALHAKEEVEVEEERTGSGAVRGRRA